MALPLELRVLCLQLSSIPVPDLPHLLPNLVQYVLQCQAPLSNANANQSDNSATSVLVHKLKMRLSTLLNGKIPEGRFTAVVMIKYMVEIGGWEVLRGSGPWVGGLLSVLVKPDPLVSKELCIIALTKIYSLTHQYPTLIREITTPTLPTFIKSCLNLISAPLSRVSSSQFSLVEVVFRSFTTLLPRHPSIFRPFSSQIRTVTRPYLAPTMSDGMFVPLPSRQSARRLVVALHQTAAKNSGGEEWGKAVRDIVKDIHITADKIFRAVIEDWESTAGYVTTPVDVNQELHGGGNTPGDLPEWNGIVAGVERLIGLTSILTEYFSSGTRLPVSIPLGAISDMISRILSLPIPSSGSYAGQESARLHPGVDRDEKDALWCSMPQIYIAGLQLFNAIAIRLEEAFIPLAESVMDQLLWIFPSGRSTLEFRSVVYTVVARILVHIGRCLNRSQASKLAPIIRACCKDLLPVDTNTTEFGVAEDTEKRPHNLSITATQNSDTLLHSNSINLTAGVKSTSIAAGPGFRIAAEKLLPFLVSNIPQQHLDISLRSLIERTAILTHNKDAMLSSILHPYTGNNGRTLASTLPHLARDFGNDDIVEILLRPRMPLLPNSNARLSLDGTLHDESGDEDEGMGFSMNSEPVLEDHNQYERPIDLGFPLSLPVDSSLPDTTSTENLGATNTVATTENSFGRESHIATPSWKTGVDTIQGGSDREAHNQTLNEDVNMTSEGESSDDESIHLTMQLDSDSDSDGQ